MSLSKIKERYGDWALITGASSGMGEEFANQLASQGMNLVLLARREDKLNELGSELSGKYGIEFRAISADLNDADFLTNVASQTEDLNIGLLVNNAGFTNHGSFLDNDLAAEERLVNVNCRAVTTLAHHYGRLMKQRNRGAIIFTASIVGFTSVPIWGTYAASKSYDLLLAEALSVELKQHNIDVMALCPGSTHSEFANYEGAIAKLLVMKSETVVKGALKNLGKRTIHIAGFMNKLTVFSLRFLPRKLVARVFGTLIRDMVNH